VYVDLTLTRSKVKVKVTGLLNFQQLAKPCMLAAMAAAPLRGFLVLTWNHGLRTTAPKRHRRDVATREVGVGERRAADAGRRRRAAARPADRPVAAVTAVEPRRGGRRHVDGGNERRQETDADEDPGDDVGPSQSDLGLLYRRMHVAVDVVVETRVADALRLVLSSRCAVRCRRHRMLT